MQKRGQLTIFLLASVVLVVLVIMTSFVREEAQEAKEIKQLRSDPTTALQKYVQGCLEKTAVEAVYQISLQGGYFQAPLASTQVLSLQIPHYWSIDKPLMPQIERIENEIDEYIEENLPGCLQDFSVFLEQGFTISSEKPVSHAAITDENVIISLEYSVDILRSDAKFSLKEFSAAVDLPLKDAYRYALAILLEQAKTPDLVPIGFIAVLAKENRFTFELINYDEDSVIVSLIFDTPIEKDYLFTFMNKYDWEAIDSMKNNG